MIFRHSRFEGAYVFQDVNNPEIMFLDPLRERQFSEAKEDFIIEIQQGDRLDLIAKSLYGDEQLEWVLLDANPNYNTPFDVKPGDQIVVPLPQRVMYNV
ncbi:baseplate wedge subunit [Bacillus phage BCD7]|uniref:LysM domain-containing protein n=1 Tax=Bacillus phage BCD7 TaxID=1136534 RepID=J9PV90_9CAUD|nr:baseplate wedge subunit [Bacillus phage BCD7]AEZ50534.1 hypothetical protein BCD7_0087 [Bacillus phage BCD7]